MRLKATLDGLEVANEAMLTVFAMVGSPVASSEETAVDAPAGTYRPPEGYEERDFDLTMLTGGG